MLAQLLHPTQRITYTVSLTAPRCYICLWGLILTYHHFVNTTVCQDGKGPLVQVHYGVVGPLVPGVPARGLFEVPVNHWIGMQSNNQIIPVLPTFLQEGKVADVEEVKSSRDINYPVAFLGTLADKMITWKMFYELAAPCSLRTRGVSGWWEETGRVPSREIWLLLLCSSRRTLHGRPGLVAFTVCNTTIVILRGSGEC